MLGDAIRVEALEGTVVVSAEGATTLTVGDTDSSEDRSALRALLVQALSRALQAMPSIDTLRVARDLLSPRIQAARVTARAQRKAGGVAEFVQEDAAQPARPAKGGPCDPVPGGPCGRASCGAVWIERHSRAAGLADDVEPHVKDPTLYRRGADLVRVAEGRAQPLDTPGVVDAISRYVHLYRLCRQGAAQVPVEVPVSAMLANVLRSRANGAFAQLRGVALAPVLLPGGLILDTPGYHRESGVLYVPSRPYGRVPEKPSREEALAAALRVLRLACDFPFVDKFHRSAWLAEV